jgi:hypothetical protein
MFVFKLKSFFYSCELRKAGQKEYLAQECHPSGCSQYTVALNNVLQYKRAWQRTYNSGSIVWSTKNTFQIISTRSSTANIKP